MDLYIGNATRQILSFHYRLPETSAWRSQNIPIGAQVRISGDLSQPDVDEVIKQNAKYGLCAFDEIDRTKAFTGLCYRVGKPIPSEKLERLMHHNTDMLVLRGKEMRKQAAIVENNRLSRTVAEDDIAQLKNFEMSIVEDKSDPSNDSPFMGEGWRISRDDNASGERSRSRGRRR